MMTGKRIEYVITDIWLSQLFKNILHLRMRLVLFYIFSYSQKYHEKSTNNNVLVCPSMLLMLSVAPTEDVNC